VSVFGQVPAFQHKSLADWAVIEDIFRFFNDMALTRLDAWVLCIYANRPGNEFF
jgi:hypothetical protein